MDGQQSEVTLSVVITSWKRTGDREVAGFLFEVSPAGGLRKSIE
jgi:hypothetical protein